MSAAGPQLSARAAHDTSSGSSAAGTGGSRAKPKVLIITGPTGVGKTEASLLLAERLNGEVVSADSVQVYRSLDVGSDKLPFEQRRGARNHSFHFRGHLTQSTGGKTHCGHACLCARIGGAGCGSACACLKPSHTA